MDEYNSDSNTNSEICAKKSSKTLTFIKMNDALVSVSSTETSVNLQVINSERLETYETYKSSDTLNSFGMLNVTDTADNLDNSCINNSVSEMRPETPQTRNIIVQMATADTKNKNLSKNSNFVSSKTSPPSLSSIASSFISSSLLSSVPHSLTVSEDNTAKKNYLNQTHMVPSSSAHSVDISFSDKPGLKEDELMHSSQKTSLVGVFFIYWNYGLITLQMWEDAINKVKRNVDSSSIYEPVKRLLSLINSSILVIKLRMMQMLNKGLSCRPGMMEVISVDEMVQYLQDFPSIHYKNFLWSTVEQLWALMKAGCDDDDDDDDDNDDDDDDSDDTDQELMKLVTTFDVGYEEGYAQSFFMNKDGKTVQLFTPKVAGKSVIKIESYDVSGPTKLVKSAVVVTDNIDGSLQELVNQLFIASAKKIINTQGVKKFCD